MVKVLVLGSTGMLGSAVGKHFLQQPEIETYLTYRNKDISYGQKKLFFDILKSNLDELPAVDYIINCAGIIKPFIEDNKENSVFINSFFPYMLSQYCQKTDTKLIHITTDCVFTGSEGNYNENHSHDCSDLYGKSKSLGEPKSCMLLRTSIIGEEVHKKASLIEWAKLMRGKEVNGYTNHYWNGITTKEYAKICHQIITKELYKEGLYHIHSDTLSKYQLLKLISKRFNLELKINPFKVETSCDRTLVTLKDLVSKLDISPIEDQINNL